MNAAPPRPTDAELAILRVLWRRGPSTVRQVHEALDAPRATGYTTTLKLMQIMTDKGLVRRDESRRSHVYQAAMRAEVVQRRLVGELVARAFGGSVQNLVLSALANRKTSPAELAEIRRMVEALEREDRNETKGEGKR